MYLRFLIPSFFIGAFLHTVLRGDEGTEADESFVKQYKVATDGASLLAFFRSRSLSEEDKKQIEALVLQLGNDSFAAREQASRKLSAYGPPARKYLEPAISSADPEVSRRARFCIEELDRGPGPALSSAAVRLLVVRKPRQAVPALLNYLPFCDDETVEEEVVNALALLGSPDGKTDPNLTAALNDSQALRRSAAAYALGRTPTDEMRGAIRNLLTDPDARVRLRSAQGLVAARDKTAIPVLIQLLLDAPLALSWQAEELLFRVALDNAPVVSVGEGSLESRRKCRMAWADWWRDHEVSVDLTRVEDNQRQLGLTLIAELDKNIVWECGPDGKPRWTLEHLQGPIDAQVLPGGRVLIAENAGMRVTERDLKGNVLWERKIFQNPICCRRLANGNTFIGSYQGVMEVTREGKEVYSYNPGHGSLIFGAQKLRNGHILCITAQNTILELDDKGKELKKIPVTTQHNWSSVEMLPGGRYLVATLTNNKIMEIDSTGKTGWECSVSGACHATRLPNGNTLVTSMTANKVLEVDRTGNTVWEKSTSGRPFHAYRR
ncbi:MAG TPA: HEAT repeat domain-containing protein [Gemmataceae bacterium]|nr:HEAT repeat domain-containing protein [Gemmataceae bacterium]